MKLVTVRIASQTQESLSKVNELISSLSKIRRLESVLYRICNGHIYQCELTILVEPTKCSDFPLSQTLSLMEECGFPNRLYVEDMYVTGLKASCHRFAHFLRLRMTTMWMRVRKLLGI